MSQFTEDKIIFETIEKELHRQQQRNRIDCIRKLRI